MNDTSLTPLNGQNVPAVEVLEQVNGMLGQMERLMQVMANALSATNQRMEQMEKQIQRLTPITGAQEKALAQRIRARAEELCGQYSLPPATATAIANAIRKEIKTTGGVRAIRELPRVEYPVYVERVDLWDDYAAMRAIRRNAGRR